MVWNWIKWIFRAEGLHGLVTSEIVAPWLWPTLAAVMIAILGMIDPVPLPFLATAVMVAFGVVALGIMQVSVLRSQNMIESKLAFDGPTYDIDIKKAKEGDEPSPAMLLNARIGFKLTSQADFPIMFRIDEVYTEFNSKVPKRSEKNMNLSKYPRKGLVNIKIFP